MPYIFLQLNKREVVQGTTIDTNFNEPSNHLCLVFSTPFLFHQLSVSLVSKQHPFYYCLERRHFKLRFLHYDLENYLP